jgi:1A family penicillin-binding protein
MRTPVPLNEVSQHLIDATLAAEDANFYANPGVEIRGIIRAAFQNVSSQGVVSGASTITQQLVRNVILDPEEKYERSITRKLKEALLAYRVTQKLSKDEILELYLNEIYYGNMAYGVEAASLSYFNKHARELTLAEAALIAGLPQAPSLYDPYRNPQAAIERRAYVLEQMARHGFITEQQAELAKRERLNLQPHEVEMKAPHWVNYIRDQLEQRFGPEVVYRSGLKVFTTLDLGLDEQLQQVAQNNAENLAVRDANNTAIVALNPKTGEILAMVGSMDYYNRDIDGQVNVLTSERQPGSSIKPLVYMTTFTKGWVPSTIVQDSPGCWKDAAGNNWCPQNFDKAFRGPVTIRAALGNSMNLPAVRALEYAGIPAVREIAQRVGITNWDEKKHLGLSLTLGGAEVRPLELAGFYAVLANNGARIPTVAITKVLDSKGNVLEDHKVPAPQQVVDPRAAYMLTHILSDNNARLLTFGPNSLINLPRPAAVKTGTTDNYRDTWTMGYTPSLVIGVWVGNTDGHPMKEVLSSMSAGKVWRESMDAALAYLNLPPEPFPRPDGITELEACGDARLRPGSPGCYREIFMSENAPRQSRLMLAPAAPARATPTPSQENAPQPEQPAPPAQPNPQDAQAKPQPTQPNPLAPAPQPTQPNPLAPAPQPTQPNPLAPAPQPTQPSPQAPAPQAPQATPLPYPQGGAAPKPSQPTPQPTQAQPAPQQKAQPSPTPQPTPRPNSAPPKPKSKP